ncbi:MAG: hypothetical protein ACK55H_08180 [Cyanobacteriota bacterium]
MAASFSSPVFSTPDLSAPDFSAPRLTSSILFPYPSVLPTPALSRVAGGRAGQGAAVRRPLAAPAIPLAFVTVLILLAMVVAPEHPRDQEAICHRHNGVAACRVW